MKRFVCVILSLIALLVIANPALSGPPASEGGWVYWVDNATNLVQRARLDGSDPEVLYDGLDGVTAPRGVAVDTTNNMVYWAMGAGSGTRKIQRAPADGRGPIATVLDLAFTPGDIKLDVPNNMMYYTRASASGKIYRANLDGLEVQELMSLFSVSALELDLSAQKIYWGLTPGLACVESKIQRSDLDGKNVEDVVTGLNYISALHVDSEARMVYWGEFWECGNQIRRANLVGRPVIETIGLGLYANDLSFDAVVNKLYWSPGDTINRSNPDGTGDEQLIDFLNGVLAIDVVPAKVVTDPADLNGDGLVSGIDLAILLGAWGMCPPRIECAADLNDDGLVNGIDLALLLGAWTS